MNQELIRAPSWGGGRTENGQPKKWKERKTADRVGMRRWSLDSRRDCKGIADVDSVSSLGSLAASPCASAHCTLVT